MSSVEAGRSAMLLCTQFRPDTTLVEVRGVVDACSAGRLSAGVGDVVGRGRPLVIDLAGVHFFGGDGFRALAEIAEKCWQTNLRWALVTSDAVDRLLRIAGPDYGLPTAPTVAAATRGLTEVMPAEMRCS